MKTIWTVFVACGLAALISCQKPAATLTEGQKQQIADSAKQVAERVLELSNNLDFNGAMQYYSADSDAKYAENGMIFPSLETIQQAYEQLAPTLELLENKVDSWNIVVLSKDAVSMTLPIHFKIKAKGLPEYNGQYVWSAVLQKRNGKWTIIQTHESWLNFAEAMAAITPPKADDKK